MQKKELIQAFHSVGEKLRKLSEEEISELAARAKHSNGWFSHESVQNALGGIAFMLDKEKLEQWVSHYRVPTENPKVVGVIMAGNIPLVGFHDLLSVLISGHFAAIKPSSDDQFLIEQLISWIVEAEPRLKKNIERR